MFGNYEYSAMTLVKKLTHYFLPKHLRENPLHPEYEEAYLLVIGTIGASMMLTGMYCILLLNHFAMPALFYNALSILIVLPFVRWNLKEPAFLINGFFLYIIYFPVILHSGGIHSANLALLYPFLLGGLVGLPKYGFSYLGGNVIFLLFLYFYTPSQLKTSLWDDKIYALSIHLFSTLLTGAVFWFVQKQKDRLLAESKGLQNSRITLLNDEVSRRIRELSNMRQTLAADFHDETGNMLSAITRQAALLKLKLAADAEVMNIVDHIISNSNQLYSSSRHFIWNLNNDSDDPQILFHYLTSFGQVFYNQFDVSFSPENNVSDTTSIRLESFAAINLIFIFKEAMNNVVKHAKASEVVLKLTQQDDHLMFSLTDNGTWKEKEKEKSHHGLSNMEKRCLQNNFGFGVNHIKGIGTRVEIAVPIVSQTVQMEPA